MWIQFPILLAIILCVESSGSNGANSSAVENSSPSYHLHPRRRHRRPPDDEEEVVKPLVIPKLSREAKIALIIKSGQDPYERRRLRTGRAKGKRKTRNLPDMPWHRMQPKTKPPPPGPAVALDASQCPARFDAVTKAFNGRIYAFARDRVYQVWRSDNLQQRASFLVNDMFPGGPRVVNAAYSNARSGVTILLGEGNLYRFRWNRNRKRFYLARKSPQKISSLVKIYPRVGFQWKDGNHILMDGDNFITFDAYWNLPTFSGKVKDYFPNFPRDLIGMTYYSERLFILYTSSNKIQVYDTMKYRVLQEYPIIVSEFVGCFRN